MNSSSGKGQPQSICVAPYRERQRLWNILVSNPTLTLDAVRDAEHSFLRKSKTTLAIARHFHTSLEKANIKWSGTREEQLRAIKQVLDTDDRGIVDLAQFTQALMIAQRKLHEARASRENPNRTNYINQSRTDQSRRVRSKSLSAILSQRKSVVVDTTHSRPSKYLGRYRNTNYPVPQKVAATLERLNDAHADYSKKHTQLKNGGGVFSQAAQQTEHIHISQQKCKNNRRRSSLENRMSTQPAQHIAEQNQTSAGLQIVYRKITMMDSKNKSGLQHVDKNLRSARRPTRPRRLPSGPPETGKVGVVAALERELKSKTKSLNQLKSSYQQSLAELSSTQQLVQTLCRNNELLLLTSSRALESSFHGDGSNYHMSGCSEAGRHEVENASEVRRTRHRWNKLSKKTNSSRSNINSSSSITDTHARTLVPARNAGETTQPTTEPQTIKTRSNVFRGEANILEHFHNINSEHEVGLMRSSNVCRDRPSKELQLGKQQSDIRTSYMNSDTKHVTTETRSSETVTEERSNAVKLEHSANSNKKDTPQNFTEVFPEALTKVPEEEHAPSCDLQVPSEKADMLQEDKRPMSPSLSPSLSSNYSYSPDPIANSEQSWEDLLFAREVYGCGVVFERESRGPESSDQVFPTSCFLSLSKPISESKPMKENKQVEERKSIEERNQVTTTDHRWINTSNDNNNSEERDMQDKKGAIKDDEEVEVGGEPTIQAVSDVHDVRIESDEDDTERLVRRVLEQAKRVKITAGQIEQKLDSAIAPSGLN